MQPQQTQEGLLGEDKERVATNKKKHKHTQHKF